MAAILSKAHILQLEGGGDANVLQSARTQCGNQLVLVM